jgi:rod shape-determining protein MreC
MAVLFVQVLGLGVQVRRRTEDEPSRLIRIWTVSAVTPLEKGLVWIQSGTSYLWHNYFYLRGVRAENRELKEEIERLRVQQVRLTEDAEQARRLQALLAFKEQFISKTTAAQVIGSSGSEQSRSIYVDKGSHDGVKPDMAVITADGIVGKVLRVFNSTSLVLLIDDQSSGVGALLAKSRLQGVLRGTPAGEIRLENVTNDEAVQPGETVVTSGGDRIFPKGLPVGTVSKASQGKETFLDIRVKPAANLGKLEEVLVITQKDERTPLLSESAPSRAVDVLASRLPSVPEKPVANDSGKLTAGTNSTPTTPVAVGTQPGKSIVLGTTARSAPSPAAPAVKSLPGNASLSSAPGAVAAKKPAAESVTSTSNVSKPPATVKPATTQNPTPPPLPAVKVVDNSAKPVPIQPKPIQPKPVQSKPAQANLPSKTDQTPRDPAKQNHPAQSPSAKQPGQGQPSQGQSGQAQAPEDKPQ